MSWFIDTFWGLMTVKIHFANWIIFNFLSIVRNQIFCASSSLSDDTCIISAIPIWSVYVTSSSDQIKRTNVRTEVFGAFATSSSLLNHVDELRLLRFLLNPATLTFPLAGWCCDCGVGRTEVEEPVRMWGCNVWYELLFVAVLLRCFLPIILALSESYFSDCCKSMRSRSRYLCRSSCFFRSYWGKMSS